LLLLLPTTTYRTEAFVDAASKLGVELVCASERPSTLQELAPEGLVTLDFKDPGASSETVARFARRRPIDAVVAVDDLTTVVAAAISERLGLKANSLSAARAARDKHTMRRCLASAGVPVPRFRLVKLADDPAALAEGIAYPCVLKPLMLSASRGVIRANDAREFVAAFRRITAILEDAASATADDPDGVRFSRTAVWLPDTTSTTLREPEPTRSSGDDGGWGGGGWSGGGGGGDRDVGGGSGGGGGGSW